MMLGCVAEHLWRGLRNTNLALVTAIWESIIYEAPIGPHCRSACESVFARAIGEHLTAQSTLKTYSSRQQVLYNVWTTLHQTEVTTKQPSFVRSRVKRMQESLSLCNLRTTFLVVLVLNMIVVYYSTVSSHVTVAISSSAHTRATRLSKTFCSVEAKTNNSFAGPGACVTKSADQYSTALSSNTWGAVDATAGSRSLEW